MLPSVDIADFNAGNYVKQAGYESFAPLPVNRQWTVSSPDVNNLLSEADHRLGELNGLSQYVPDIDFFIFMHIIKEATTSSKIEGTQTTIREALLRQEDIAPEKRDDWQEVQCYIEAMNFSIVRLDKLPLSNRLLKQAHKKLLRNVRGKDKMPGEFRTSQNWIGGATLNDAVFIPPLHTEVPELMGDLEKFLHNDKIMVPHLVRIAIAHYQFETIHPFLDGNGRLGRLLITLYLVSAGILTRPTLYLSAFFEKNRLLYYDNLSIVRTANNLNQWLKFFLQAITETSTQSFETFKAILELKEDVERRKIVELGRKLPLSRRFIQELYRKPILNAAQTAELLQITAPTANALIKDFVRLGILKESTGFKRNRIFLFDDYLKLFQA